MRLVARGVVYYNRLIEGNSRALHDSHRTADTDWADPTERSCKP